MHPSPPPTRLGPTLLEIDDETPAALARAARTALARCGAAHTLARAQRTALHHTDDMRAARTFADALAPYLLPGLALVRVRLNAHTWWAIAPEREALAALPEGLRTRRAPDGARILASQHAIVWSTHLSAEPTP